MAAKVALKGCTRCGGDLYSDGDDGDRCLQCARLHNADFVTDLNPCKCGCGALVKGTFKQGHHMRGSGVKRDDQGRYVR